MKRAALAPAFLAVLSLLVPTYAVAPAQAARCDTCTGGAIRVQADALTKRTVDGWGYDIKQPGKAKELAGSKALRDRVFGTAGMTVLRIPIYATADVNPARDKPINPAPTDPDHQIAPIVAAVKAVKADYPQVKVFASLKLGTARKPLTTFAPWLFSKGQVDPTLYAIVLRKNLLHLHEQGVRVDVLGIDNEAALNKGELSAADHKYLVGRLSTGLSKVGVPKPAFIAPENYFPDSGRLDGLGRSGTYQYAGTHFYSKEYAKQAPMLTTFAGKARTYEKTLWDSEFHWNVTDNKDTSTGAVMGDAMPAMRSALLHFDAGFTGLTWWSYQPATSSKPWGAMHEALVRGTNGARPLKPTAVHDVDGASINSKLITRAFKRGNTLVLFIVNTATTGVAQQKIVVAGATLNGDPAVTTFPSNPLTATRSGNTVTLNVPKRSIQVVTVPAAWG